MAWPVRGASSARRGRGGRSCGTVGSKIIISGRYPLHAEILRPVERRPGLFSLPCLLLHGCRTLLVTLFRLHRSQIFECYSYCWHGFDCARHSATCGRRRGSRMASIASRLSQLAPKVQSRSRISKSSGQASCLSRDHSHASPTSRCVRAPHDATGVLP